VRTVRRVAFVQFVLACEIVDAKNIDSDYLYSSGGPVVYI